VILNGVKRPFMPFRDAVAASRAMTLPGWPFEGPSATRETQQGLPATGLEWTAHGLDFISKAGFSRESGTARLRECISESPVQFQSYDLPDVTNPAGCEYLVRAMLGSEIAVRKNLVVPDYPGLGSLLVSSLDPLGGLRTHAYARCVAVVQRDEAQVLKQSRLWNEERALQYRSTVGAVSSGEPRKRRRRDTASPSPSPRRGRGGHEGRGRGRGRGGSSPYA